LARRSQLHHFVSHLDDIGKTHLIQPLGQSHRVCRHDLPSGNVLAMKSRYLYLAASVAFLVVAILKLLPPRNLTAAALNAVTGCIFLFLGAGPRKPM